MSAKKSSRASSGPSIAVLLRGRRAARGTPALRALGPCERAALRAALHLRAALGGRVTAFAFGPASLHDPALMLALRAGCSRAMRVDPGELTELDYLGVARALLPAVRTASPDLVLCGDRSHDGGQGAVGPALAGLLEMPHLSGLVSLTPGAAAGELITVQRAGGRRHRYRCRLPLVACLAAYQPEQDAAALRHAPVAERRAAEVEVVTLRDLKLDVAELARRQERRPAPAPAPAKPVLLFGTPDELVAHLADKLLLS